MKPHIKNVLVDHYMGLDLLISSPLAGESGMLYVTSELLKDLTDYYIRFVKRGRVKRAERCLKDLEILNKKIDDLDLNQYSQIMYINLNRRGIDE